MHTEYESEPITSETRLWKAVLWRAFDDLFYKGLERSLVVAKKSAKLWFQNRDKDFRLVCLFAAYEPEYVLDQYKRLRKTREDFSYTQEQKDYLKQRERYLNDYRRRF